jgi:hypothetical protein
VDAKNYGDSDSQYFVVIIVCVSENVLVHMLHRKTDNVLVIVMTSWQQ